MYGIQKYHYLHKFVQQVNHKNKEISLDNELYFHCLGQKQMTFLWTMGKRNNRKIKNSEARMLILNFIKI